jgi:CO/xanthine dehydrogenase FAD-binding subunit
MAVWFADDQIRESATIGGNIVNASPAGDGFPPLLTANAQVEIGRLEDGRLARRSMPLDEFVLGPGRTALGRDEILIAVEADALPDYGGAFEKVGHRRSLVISVACLSALVKLDGAAKRFEDVRLAIAGVGPVPSRMSGIEAALKGEAVTPALLAAAVAGGGDYVRSRSRVAYRRAVLPRFISRAIAAAAGAAGAHPDTMRALEENFDA